MNNYPIDTTNILSNGKFTSTSTISTSLHYHRQIEFIYLQKGSLDVLTEKETIHLNSGEAIVLKPLELHRLCPLAKNSYLLVILPEKISLKLISSNFFETKLFVNIDHNAKQLLDLHKIFTAMDTSYQKLFYEIILEIIKHLYNISSSPDISTKILEYINANFKSQISLDSIAKACLTNRTYVSNTINKITGLHFNEYINKLRIAHFLDTYNPTKSTTIEDMAINCGFNNVRTFYRAFHDELHYTPHEYFTINKSLFD